MYWMKDAIDTLDILLTYGPSDDPLFVRTLTSYRELAREQNRAAAFEEQLQALLALRRPDLLQKGAQ